MLRVMALRFKLSVCAYIMWVLFAFLILLVLPLYAQRNNSLTKMFYPREYPEIKVSTAEASWSRTLKVFIPFEMPEGRDPKSFNVRVSVGFEIHANMNVKARSITVMFIMLCNGKEFHRIKESVEVNVRFAVQHGEDKNPILVPSSLLKPGENMLEILIIISSRAEEKSPCNVSFKVIEKFSVDGSGPLTYVKVGPKDLDRDGIYDINDPLPNLNNVLVFSILSIAPLPSLIRRRNRNHGYSAKHLN
ncbi:MAG: hypothetical protein DRJ51_05960 [Thermoprotei archaeon]|nr:MAG: hypothetical protein DRJ51_05960 [Thermoprotei archaeon]RLF02074.1 MAG: hypothetical protein DRJ59_04570 [Thermoprotei archaeon]